jgi:hypothetical protein
MEKYGPHEPSFEQPAFEPSGTSEKKKDDKEKRKEKSSKDSKKEQAAVRAKELVDKLVLQSEPVAESKQEFSIDSILKKEPKEAEDSKEQKAEVKESGESAVEASAEEHTDPTVENLTPTEQMEVVRAYAKERLSELEAGKSEFEDPKEAAARQADIELMESLLEDGENDDMDQAELTHEVEVEEQTHLLGSEHDTVLEETDEPEELPADEPVLLDSPAKPTAASAVPPKPAPAASGGQQPPLHPPRAVYVPGAAAGPANYAPNHNLAPHVPAAKREYEPDYSVNPNATYLLVGGIVGYFIGRRRGRIQTEKRMKVVQRKLEKQVTEIQHTVVQKELEVQKLARDNYWQHTTSRSTPERAVTEHALPERPATGPAPEQRAAIPVADVPIEARRVPESLQRPERVAPVAIASEVRGAPLSRPANESRPNIRPENARPEKQIGKHEVKEFTKLQLLETGEKIKVGSTNLKRIFEAKLITESGLKRLVHEHLENKDIRRGLAREFLAKELSYERDPRFRDLLPPEVARRSAGGAAALDTRLSDASDIEQNDTNKLRTQEADKAQKKQKAEENKQSQSISNGLLAALTLLALGLALYAVLLSLLR